MTRNQRILLISLVLLNVVCFCGLAPILLLSPFLGSAPQAVAQGTAARPTPTVIPTRTQTTTPTPQATNTLVISGPPTVTPRAIEAGWKFYQISDQGFGIALPPDWQKVDFDRDKLAQLMQMLNEKNPEFASTVASQRDQMIAANIKFFGVDVSNEALSSGLVTNVNVYRDALASAVPMNTYVRLSIQNLEKLPNVSKPVAHKRIKLPAGEAEQIQYQVTVATSTGTITSSATQYLLLRGNAGYIITFSTQPDKDNIYAPVFTKIAQSWQWVP